MTPAFPYSKDSYTWPRVGVIYDDGGAAELNVHCLCDMDRRRFYCVGFVDVDREKQIDEVINLAEEVGAEVRMITRIGFTDEIINALMAKMKKADDGGSCCCIPVDWPSKIQRRILRKLAELTAPGGAPFSEERLALRLHLPLDEVRHHLEVLADIGLLEKVPENESVAPTESKTMPDEPNEAQRRVLLALRDMALEQGNGIPDEELAQRLNMSMGELRRHIQALVGLGMVQMGIEHRPEEPEN
jgi:transcription initiation factor IIE alpha subunit